MAPENLEHGNNYKGVVLTTTRQQYIRPAHGYPRNFGNFLLVLRDDCRLSTRFGAPPKLLSSQGPTGGLATITWSGLPGPLPVEVIFQGNVPVNVTANFQSTVA